MKLWEAAAAAAGVQIGKSTIEGLHGLASWLRAEAISAGGLGPNEGPEIESRHVADSILFAAGWARPPSACWDLGAGVGLPGLVLSLLWPQTHVVLVDSSQRRCDLAARAARVIGAEVAVKRVRIEELGGPLPAIVSRAAIPAQRFRPILTRLLARGATAVISGGSETPDGFVRIRFPEFFDQRSRLLMMRAP